MHQQAADAELSGRVAALAAGLPVQFLCDRSHEKCSTLLNIHRSTLRYRLGQIREAGELSLDDMTPVKKLNLILSLSAAAQSIDSKNE